MIVLVVGMHRSGTSLVARGLHAMGVNLGSRIDTAPHPANPHGHWEHADVWQAQERLLIRCGREWHSSPGPLPARWLEWPDARATIDRFVAIAAEELVAHGHWLVKDPRSSLLVPLWREVARRAGVELRIVRVFRAADDVAASLAARNAMPHELAVRIWSDHQRSIDRDTVGLAVLVVHHDDVLHEPLAAFTAMGAFCGISDAADRASAAAAFVDPQLWHHRSLEQAGGVTAAELVADAPADAGPADLGRVLIVMRTRWRLHMLPRAIRSVLSQTYPHWFLQIVNDGGPPHLVEDEVTPYRHLLEGRLGILHRDRQHGMEAASNAGIAAGPGEFIVIHDDDDSWSPEFLARMVGRLHTTGEMAAVSRSRLVREAWERSEYVRRKVIEFGPMIDRITADDLATTNRFPPIAFVFRRRAYEEVGPFHAGLPALGDWHFNRRIAARHAIGVLPESLAHWHLREPSDRIPNSPRLDHWRFEPSVAAWPDPAALPEFFSQARQVRIQGDGSSIAALPHFPLPVIGATVNAAVPAGLYLIRFRHASPVATPGYLNDTAVFLRTAEAYTRGRSVPFTAEPGELITILVNAREPILELGIGVGPDAIASLQPLPAGSEAVRLGDPLGTLDDFAGRPRLPDVLCIGAQRSGTTWLHAVLQQHPQVWRCGIKEFHHFDQDGSDPAIGEFRQRQALAVLATAAAGSPDDIRRSRLIRMELRHGFPPAESWENYAAIFESAPDDQLACDFTPAYATLAEEAVAEIARVMPDVKVIFMLRDPVTRAVSGGMHQLRREGVERPTAAQLLAACESPANVLRTDYVRTLDIWQRHLPAERLLVLFHDDIARDPAAVIDRTCRFLGIESRKAEVGDESGHLTPRNRGEIPLPAPELARVKAAVSRRWLPMLMELERRHPEPVQQWRLAAERRIEAAGAADAGSGAGREHTVHNNLSQWDARDPWTGDGDGWDGQARACGVPYPDWKAGLIARYLPLFRPRGTILEIGPGHGRWSDLIIGHAGLLVLCDIAPNCLDACRQRLAGRGRLRTHLSRAADLPADLSAAVDGVWSYDCLVHVGPEEFRRYLVEIARVLRPGGLAVLHHADRGGGGLLQRAVSRFAHWRGGGAEVATGRDAPADQPGDHGWRSPVSRADVRAWARAAGLTVMRQESQWTWQSPRGRLRIGVPRFGDCITVLRNGPTACGAACTRRSSPW
jgi:SAM-dependent methyltransferase